MRTILVLKLLLAVAVLLVLPGAALAHDLELRVMENVTSASPSVTSPYTPPPTPAVVTIQPSPNPVGFDAIGGHPRGVR
ncbi:MAG: hypothetical protein ACREIN_00070 [Candidatus Methylomirabilaceae bacterium]